MFLDVPFSSSSELQNVVLILNTVLLIIVLIVIELFYSETPKDKKTHLKLFFPFIAVFVGLFIVAVLKQVSGA
ncbi:hypothetical protein CYG49_02520 [Candidatus Saccharibacteria bacterium]|nr:MAG: hypothetical protein CYG49_02520 [Candidatus Saccharibacteria bacterium]